MNKSDKPWIDKMMGSLDKVQKVQPDEDFLKRMEYVAQRIVFQPNKVNRLTLFSIAASLAVLILANVLIVSQSRTDTPLSQQPPMENSEEGYLLIPTKTFSYE